MHEAKTHLSRLVRVTANGEPFIIAHAGKPMVKVIAVDVPEPAEAGRLGFLAHEISLPEEFDRMGSAEIEAPFERPGRVSFSTRMFFSGRRACRSVILVPFVSDFLP